MSSVPITGYFGVSLHISREWVCLSPHEICSNESMGSTEGGETYRQLMNMEPLGSAVARQRLSLAVSIAKYVAVCRIRLAFGFVFLAFFEMLRPVLSILRYLFRPSVAQEEL